MARNSTTKLRKTLIATTAGFVYDLEQHTSVSDPAGVVLGPPEAAAGHYLYDEEIPDTLWDVVGIRDRDGRVVPIEQDEELDVFMYPWDHPLAVLSGAALADVAGVATRLPYGQLDISFDVVRRLAGEADVNNQPSLFGTEEDLTAFGWTGRAPATPSLLVAA